MKQHFAVYTKNKMLNKMFSQETITLNASWLEGWRYVGRKNKCESRNVMLNLCLFTVGNTKKISQVVSVCLFDVDRDMAVLK